MEPKQPTDLDRPRTAARALLGVVEGMLNPDDLARPSDLDAWGAVVDACGVLGIEPDPTVEASADSLGNVVRAARAFIVAADELRATEGDCKAWGEVVAQAGRLRREAQARTGARGRRSRALLQASAEACAVILDQPDYPEGGLAPVVESVAKAVEPFGEAVES